MPRKKEEESPVKKTTTSKKKTTTAEKATKVTKATKETKAQTQTKSTTKQKASTKRAAEDVPLPFEVGSHVFYPHEGLGLIRKLEHREFDGKDTLYYEIFFESQKMISHIPVKNVKLLKLRKVISKSNAQKVIKSLAATKDALELSWKDRLNLYQEILKKGSALEMADIVSTLYGRRKIKPLSFQERQYYEFALESLVGEIAVALNIEKELANEKVHSALETSASKS